MSRIYFHFRDREDIEVYGTERGYMACLINDLAFPCYGLHEFGTADDPLIGLMDGLNPTSDRLYLDAKLWILGLCSENIFALPDGRRPDSWTTSLNTVSLIGQPMLRLFVRLHGQCEIHCWADTEDVSAIQAAIKAGMDSHLYRSDDGWRQLLEIEPQPFVCSYSICQQFPNTNHLDTYDMSEADLDKWCDRPFRERWDECFAALKQGGDMLRLKDLDRPYSFGDGLTAFDIRRIANEIKMRDKAEAPA